MWKVLARARKRFAGDQRGNVAVIFAVSAIPLVGLIGGAADLARHIRHKTAILNAMDSAAVALVRRGAANDEDADRFVNDFIAAMLPEKRDPMLKLARFDATDLGGGYRISSAGSMDTAFMPVLGIDAMPIEMQSEVMKTGGRYEVALALDNTGSMAQRNKIGDLKVAADSLVERLYEKPGAKKLVRMALVPFVTAVNVRGEAFDPAWLDRTASGLHALDNFDRRIDRLSLFAGLGDGAVDANGVPKSWKGCVEAREEHDLDDTAPSDGIAATRWVPFLWPDDSDVGGPGPYSYSNNYLKDGVGGKALARMRSVDKYLTPIRVAGSRSGEGPNKSCPGPVVELTNDQDRIGDAIKAMKPHSGSGTNIAQGLAWGWRVLSPEAPFTQGASYSDRETQKVLVLMSDGKNEIFGDYTGYGHLADNRLGKTIGAALVQMNRNVETVCQKVKDQKIMLYMILLQVNDKKTQDIFEECASVHKGKRLYFYAPDGDALRLAFEEIGKDLTQIRVTR